MNENISTIRIADGCITKLHAADDTLQVFLRNWREETQILSFCDVIGIEAFSFLNADLSQAKEMPDDSFLEKSCSIGEEQPTNFRCYAFYTAWSESPILKIVARSFSVTAPTAAASGT